MYVMFLSRDKTLGTVCPFPATALRKNDPEVSP